MHKRVLILPLAALVITGLVVYRLQHERPLPPGGVFEPPAPRQLAPPFELYNQHGKLTNLKAYLGRTKLVIVFFDGHAADSDPWLTRLRDAYPMVKKAGAEVIGIGRTRPAENREAEKRAGVAFPFPVLSDINQQSPAPLVDIQWGLYDAGTNTTRTGVFLIDRAGMVPWQDSTPLPVRDPDYVVDTLCRGEWPATLE